MENKYNVILRDEKNKILITESDSDYKPETYWNLIIHNGVVIKNDMKPPIENNFKEFDINLDKKLYYCLNKGVGCLMKGLVFSYDETYGKHISFDRENNTEIFIDKIKSGCYQVKTISNDRILCTIGNEILYTIDNHKHYLPKRGDVVVIKGCSDEFDNTPLTIKYSYIYNGGDYHCCFWGCMGYHNCFDSSKVMYYLKKNGLENKRFCFITADNFNVKYSDKVYHLAEDYKIIETTVFDLIRNKEYTPSKRYYYSKEGILSYISNLGRFESKKS